MKKENKKEHFNSIQRQLEVMILVSVILCVLIMMFDVIPFEYSLVKTMICEAGIFYVMFAVVFIVCKLQTLKFDLGFKVDKIGLILILVMLTVRFCIAEICDITGVSPIGFSFLKGPKYIISFLVYNIFAVAFVEEFIFRIYFQETIKNWLGKCAYIAPFISSVIFALYHYLTGNTVTVVLAFIMGLMWGYVRYYSKHCSFWVLVITHGLSNYMLYVMSIIAGLGVEQIPVL